MTYRDRRQARAERLDEWAGKREAAVAAVFKDHERYRGDHAFNFQPGHIPERARVIAREERAFESMDVAESMRSRAAGIEAQLAVSIYDDDPDAIPRLRERIAGLEKERADAKAANDAYRREHRAELAAMKPSQRRDALPYPPYHFANLTGNLSRQRQRLARLERTAAEAAELAAAPSANGVTVRAGRGGWTEVQFAEKPPRETLRAMHEHGFHWVKAGGYWAGTDAAWAATLAEGGDER